VRNEVFAPVRTVPRPRRHVSGAILRALSPLFRYSSWRRAWILRGIGERFGPVLVRRDRPTAREQLRPDRVRPVVVLSVTACALCAAAAGYVTAEIVSTKDRAAVASVGYTSNLNSILEDLSAARTRNEPALRSARDAHHQALAATALAAAYRRAAAALLRPQSGRGAAANEAFARAVRETGEAYAALALAAARADSRAYPALNARLRRAGAALVSAFARLHAAGDGPSMAASNAGT
jgi:hypothetical protein